MAFRAAASASSTQGPPYTGCFSPPWVEHAPLMPPDMLYVPSWHSSMYPLPLAKLAMQLKQVQVPGAGWVMKLPRAQKLYP